MAKEQKEPREKKVKKEEAKEVAGIAVAKIEDRIDEVKDEITGQILVCNESGTSYKIIPQELTFYRHLGIPLPRISPNERYQQLLQRRTPRKLWDRNCENCGNLIRAVYSPNRKEKVLCETCYQSAVLS